MQSTEAHFSSEGLEDEPGILQESFSEVVELSAVKYFSVALQNAQRQTLVAEGPKKCVHTAPGQGKSDRTIQRHKRARMQMEAKGFLSLPEFLKQKSKNAMQQGSIEVVLRLSWMLGSTWVERLWPRRLALWWQSFCFRYLVRALGLWQYWLYVVTRVWEISQVYEVFGGGSASSAQLKLDWHKNSDLGSEVGIVTDLNSTTNCLMESVALLTK